MPKQVAHLICILMLLSIFPKIGTICFGNDEPACVSENSAVAEMPPPPPQMPPGMRRHHGKGDRMPPPVRYYFTQLKQENPAEYERLLKLRMEDREQFMKEMAKRLPRQHDPAEEKFRELDQKCWELSQQLQAVPLPENADELRNQLNELVAESVDSMIQQTQQRLEEIQARLKQMELLRDRIVQQRLDFYLKHPRPPKPPLSKDGEKAATE